MARYAVTGGAGFIGSHLVGAILAAGHEAAVVDDLSSGSRGNLPPEGRRLRLIVGDVCDRSALRRAFRGAEAVFHLAARTSVPESVAEPAAYHRVNAGGTLEALSAAREAGVRRFVLAASCAAYGDTGGRAARETLPAAPSSPYAAAKLAAEAYVHAFRGSFGFDAVALRFFNVYGPRQRPDSPYAAVVPRFLDALLSGRRPVVYGTGEQTRDMVYAGDVAAACLAVAGARGPLSPLDNVGTGRSASVLAILRGAARALGVPANPRFEPARPGEILRSRADVSRLRDEVGFEASVPLREGLRRTAEWARSRRGAED
ncbi:MAG: NAD-dependent epimerase/dehydratase family protein [Planctomycetes bacterium]|nr:NAD-dependent epimerase/dehydratase family protein [Planctomycetota bacterium]